MNKLFNQIKQLCINVPEEFPNIKFLKKQFAFVQKIPYTKDEAYRLYVLGKLLEKIGSVIQEQIADNASQEDIDEPLYFGDATISMRKTYKTEYPDDEQLNKYSQLRDKLKKELGDIDQSFKNRQKQLEQEGKAKKFLNNKSLVVRI